MILIDYNQVVISNLLQQVNNSRSGDLDEALIRHMVLNSIRAYNKQYREKYGDLVVCCDGPTYWRKEYFPLYKASRKKHREQHHLDWKLIFDTLDKLKGELREYFPYRVINLPRAEADDVIGVLAERAANNFPGEEVLVVSSDKDFLQLQAYSGVAQYSPILKKWLRTDDPERFLKEHVIRGDTGDGVPNFLSPDRVFVDGGRQKAIRQVDVDRWLGMDEDEVRAVNPHGWDRNKRLVDLREIPPDVVASIADAYDGASVAPRRGLLSYFIAHKLKNLMDSIGDF